MAKAKKNVVTDEMFAAEVEKLQDSLVESTPKEIKVKKEDKDHAAIHNMQAHDLGAKWGKETIKKNGLEIKYLRQALDIINNIGEVQDVVSGYTEAGGDKATASRIKKIMTAAMEDPAARAIVFDVSSNSLQGAYQKIRELEKKAQQGALEDGEGELLGDVSAGYIPEGIDVKELVLHLNEVLEQVKIFDDKAAKNIKAAIKSLESRSASHGKAETKAAGTVWETWEKARKEKFMGHADVVPKMSPQPALQ